MDEWDKAMSAVEARIDLEKRERNQEYIKKLQALDAEQRKQISELGYGLGTTYPFQVRRAEIETKHQQLCQDDEIKFQSYRDNIQVSSDKKETVPTPEDRETEAETRWQGLNNAFKNQIPQSVLKAFQDTYGKPALDRMIQQDKERAVQKPVIEKKPDIFDEMIKKEKQREAANQNPITKTGDIFDQMLQVQRQRNGQSQ